MEESNTNINEEIQAYELAYGTLTDKYPFDSSVSYSSYISNNRHQLELNSDGTFWANYVIANEPDYRWIYFSGSGTYVYSSSESKLTLNAKDIVETNHKTNWAEEFAKNEFLQKAFNSLKTIQIMIVMDLIIGILLLNVKESGFTIPKTE